ncbi:MAG TPA: outer membrane beta-barrel protein [Puia sp.]|nr:outer membrane beta-barrel protein [Puia sp.]
MKKCAVFILLLYSIRGNGQWYAGVEAGGTRDYLITTTGGEAFTSYHGATGFLVDIPVQYRVNDWLAFESGAGFEQKNYMMSRTGFFQGVGQKNSNGYLQLPLLGDCSFGGKKIRGFVKAGVYGAYWLTGRIKGNSPNILNTTDTTTLNPSGVLNVDNGYTYNQRYAFSSKDNRIELGWLAGAGIRYQVNGLLCLYLEGRYAGAFTDQQKKYQLNQTPRYNSTYGIGIGSLFNLKRIL